MPQLSVITLGFYTRQLRMSDCRTSFLTIEIWRDLQIPDLRGRVNGDRKAGVEIGFDARIRLMRLQQIPMIQYTVYIFSASDEENTDK